MGVIISLHFGKQEKKASVRESAKIIRILAKHSSF
jgi:hypothetical protein